MRKIRIFKPKEIPIVSSPIAGMTLGDIYEYQETNEIGSSDIIDNEMNPEDVKLIKESGKIWKRVYIGPGNSIIG